MLRVSAVLLLAALVSAALTACAGTDAAREAGESARGGGGGGGGEPSVQTESPRPASAEERTQEEVAAEEATVTEPVLDEKWYQDSDGNYVPDFIEVGEGYDPAKDDCAPEECPGAAEGVDFYTQPRNALLILDSSGSMAADDGTGTGRTKMQAAKDALLKYSGVSSVLFETGFMVFGHEGDTSEAGRPESCEAGGEVLSPIGEVDPATFEGTLSRFEPTGWTPIEGALDEAEGAFSGKEDQINRVILVSDGVETCGGTRWRRPRGCTPRASS